MRITALLFSIICFSFSFSQTITDYDGNIYNTATIGSQVWLQQNLKTSHYRNGDLIPNVTNGSSWSILTTGARCYYNNDSVSYSAVYGTLYNFYAASDLRGICPAGFHLPTEQEWTTLVDYLGGHNLAGGKMKETGTTYWQTPNTGATNLSGFSALGTGYRYYQGNFDYFRQHSYWCSSTSYNNDTVWGGRLNYNDATAMTVPLNKKQAFFVRCVRDYPANIDESGLNNILIFPNPVSENLFMQFQEPANCLIDIYDATGKIIRSITVTASDGNDFRIGLESINSGVYIVKLTFENRVQYMKFVKEEVTDN